jgi:hypothetical protein
MSSTTEPQVNRRFLTIVVALVSVCLASTAYAAPQFFKSDLTLRATETASSGRGGDRTTTVTTYMSGGVVKRSSSDGNDTILRLDEGKMVIVDNNKKTYSEVTFQEMQAMMDAAGAPAQNLPPEAAAAMQKMMGGAATTPITVTKTGPGEPIAGYATEKYQVTGPMAMEIWAAPDLKVPPQFYDAIKVRMPRNPMFDMGKLYDEMKKIGGYPLKQNTTMTMMNVEAKSTMVVTAVDKTPIPKTTFDVPVGYKKVAFAQK